jgi:predicted transcriptional regulator
MSEQTLNIVAQIRARLRATLRRITFSQLLTGLLLILSLLASVWLLLVAIEAGFWLNTSPRTMLFWAFVALGIGGIAWFVGVPLLRLLGILPRESVEETAKRVGRRFPNVEDRLVNLLQLSSDKHSEAPNPLLEGAVQMLSRQVVDVPFEKVEDFKKPMKASRWLLVPIVGLAAFMTFAPKAFLSASERLLSPGKTFEKPALFHFSVSPGSTKVVKGASLPLTANTRGRLMPIRATLELGNLNEDQTNMLALTADSSGAFKHLLNNIRQPMRYRFMADGITTDWYNIEVMDRPAIKNLQVSVAPPSYSRQPAQTLSDNVGDVAGLPGTNVSLAVQLAGEDISEATLTFGDGSSQKLDIQGDKAYGGFTLRKDNTYQIHIKNAAQIMNDSPVTYTMTVGKDEPPMISITEPSADTNLTESLEVDVVARLTDDYGFSRANLCYRLAQRLEGEAMKDSKCLALPMSNPQMLDQEIAYNWQLPESTHLDLREGDVIEYYVQVWDNNSVSGYQTARSAIHTLKIPSLTDQFKQLHEQENQSTDEIDSMLNKSNEMKDLFEDLRDDLRRKQSSDWEDQRQLQRMQNIKSDMENQVEALKQQMKEALQQMQENNLADEKTKDDFKELQKQTEELNSPELKELLEKLAEAMKQMNPMMMEQTMQQTEQVQEQLRQKIERLKELLKKLQTERKMEEMAQRMDELAEKEDRMADQIEEMRKDNQITPQEENKIQQLEREQQQAKEQAKELEQKMTETKQQMDQMKDAPKEQMERMKEELERENMPQQMEENKQEMEQGRKEEQEPKQNQQMQRAQQQQRNMAQKMRQKSSQMRQMQQEMNEQQDQANLQALRRVLDDVLTLSREQEALRIGANGLSPDNPKMRRIAQQQTELSDGLKTVRDSLDMLSKKIPKLNAKVLSESARGLGEMDRAVSLITERQVQFAGGNQKQAMTHLNELALLLSDAMQQIQQGMGGSGKGQSMQQMMQQMGQMSQQQRQMNRQTDQMLQETNGQRMGQGQQAQQQRAQQLARMQQEIKKQLEELNKNGEFRKNVAGDMQKLGDDMEENIRELMQNNVSRQTVFRQQQILTRLLEAQQSLQTRGREQKREAERARDTNRTTPKAITPQERSTQIRRDLIRALDSGYAPDYERLIKKYFELLQQGN